MRKVKYFNVCFDAMTPDAVLGWVYAQRHNDFQYVVTPNVDHIVRLDRDGSFAALYKEAGLIVCDSRIARSFVKLFFRDDIGLVTGSDLTSALFASFASNAKICIVGGTAEVIDLVIGKYGLADVVHYDPPMGFVKSEVEVDKCVSFVCAAKAEFIFICVGSPQQEILASKIKQSGACRGVGLCVGASLLFLAGKEKRAPKIIQLMHLEWFYRLCLNPRKMAKRYLVDDLRIFKIFTRELVSRFN